jgi:hypothetical protein
MASSARSKHIYDYMLLEEVNTVIISWPPIEKVNTWLYPATEMEITKNKSMG